MVELVPHRQLSGHFFATISCILIIVLSNAVVPTSAARVCKSTSNPALCDSLTVPKGNSGNVYDSGRHYVRESLISTDKYLSLIDKYLKHPDGLSVAEIRALQDCRLLIQLSKDFFLNSFKVVNKTSKVLPTLDADDVQTKLSACLTNTQTCLDGLQQAPLKSSGVRTEIVDPLSSDAKIFQLSLDSFTKGWVPEKRKIPPRPHAPRKLPPLPHGHRPKISEHHREVYETVVSNRKLLQSNSDETVQIRDIAIVSQDGTEQYMTVSDAVAMAPLDSNSTTGYYLVYVMAGVYNEIVSIGKDQKYVMIIGDGIDKTVITGNRSVTDGYTTYNTSTFGGLLFTISRPRLDQNLSSI
ncbi:OLC1v1004305C1 [Oldenlandia corymbosa var. corymbosa]|uniref:OLC1v1004305C1 n=1 Tax=Oldenlandia corymbosa var. corymbosa TaxID=529605 RepID=A0AAV1DC04_OLDCO|nr:OLC1v1004305C1 [Oldenlandia corymbosa var. corymbosa]